MRTRPAPSVLLALICAGPLAATDYVVNRYDDPAPGACDAAHCSLREAVLAANASPDADRILLSAGSYIFSISGTEDDGTHGDLDLLQPVEVIGPGAAMTTIDADSRGAVFDVWAAGTGARLVGLSLTRGLNVGSGGGVVVRPGAKATVEECELRNNKGTGHTISVLGGELTMRRSLLTGNIGNGLSLSDGAVATLENVTLTGSSANEATVNGTGSSFLCRQCTLRNAVRVLLVNGFENGSAHLENSVLAGPCAYINGGGVTSSGGNLAQDLSCELPNAADQEGVGAADLALGALADNGGPTKTILPGGASFALDSGAGGACTALAADQRSAPRPSTGCDSGSVEASAGNPDSPIFHDGFLQGHTGAWSATVAE